MWAEDLEESLLEERLLDQILLHRVVGECCLTEEVVELEFLWVLILSEAQE